jgi:hypothetical protein
MYTVREKARLRRFTAWASFSPFLNAVPRAVIQLASRGQVTSNEKRTVGNGGSFSSSESSFSSPPTHSARGREKEDLPFASLSPSDVRLTTPVSPTPGPSGVALLLDQTVVTAIGLDRLCAGVSLDQGRCWAQTPRTFRGTDSLRSNSRGTSLVTDWRVTGPMSSLVSLSRGGNLETPLTLALSLSLDLSFSSVTCLPCITRQQSEVCSLVHIIDEEPSFGPELRFGVWCWCCMWSLYPSIPRTCHMSRAPCSPSS